MKALRKMRYQIRSIEVYAWLDIDRIPKIVNKRYSYKTTSQLVTTTTAVQTIRLCSVHCTRLWYKQQKIDLFLTKQNKTDKSDEIKHIVMPILGLLLLFVSWFKFGKIKIVFDEI